MPGFAVRIAAEPKASSGRQVLDRVPQEQEQTVLRGFVELAYTPASLHLNWVAQLYRAVQRLWHHYKEQPPPALQRLFVTPDLPCPTSYSSAACCYLHTLLCRAGGFADRLESGHNY